jgi:hypothetical protein
MEHTGGKRKLVQCVWAGRASGATSPLQTHEAHIPKERARASIFPRRGTRQDKTPTAGTPGGGSKLRRRHYIMITHATRHRQEIQGELQQLANREMDVLSQAYQLRRLECQDTSQHISNITRIARWERVAAATKWSQAGRVDRCPPHKCGGDSGVVWGKSGARASGRPNGEISKYCTGAGQRHQLRRALVEGCLDEAPAGLGRARRGGQRFKEWEGGDLGQM